jgi:hypothetical protein
VPDRGVLPEQGHAYGRGPDRGDRRQL